MVSSLPWLTDPSPLWVTVQGVSLFLGQAPAYCVTATYPRHSFSFSQKFTIFRKSSLDIPQQSSNYSRPSGYTEGSKHLHGAPSKRGIPRRVDCVCPTCAFRPELFGSSTADLWVWTSFVVVLSWALEGCLGLPRWH